MHKILFLKFQLTETPTTNFSFSTNNIERIEFQLWKRFSSPITFLLFGELTGTMSPVGMDKTVKWSCVWFTAAMVHRHRFECLHIQPAHADKVKGLK